MIRAARGGAWLLLGTAVAVVALTGIAARVAPLLGHELYAIRSGSMEPAIGVGALVVVERGATPRVGDVVAFRHDGGPAIIHRAAGSATTADGTWLTTRGDANAGDDPRPVPTAAVEGTVRWVVPGLGYLLGLLGMPLGVVSLASWLAALGTLTLLLEPRGSPRYATDAPRPA